MNIFRVLASGRFPLREEVISAFVAYLLNPRMDHGLGPTVLAELLQAIGADQRIPALAQAAQRLDHRLRSDLFGDHGEAAVELELPYPAGTSIGYIDIVVRCEGWFIGIENKIALSSSTPGQLQAQYLGLRQVLAQRGLADQRLLMIYLVPAARSADGWSVLPSSQDELAFERAAGDHAALVTWQPTAEGALSLIDLLRSVLVREGRGEQAPLGAEIRHTLLALIDFALGEFQGYPSDRTVASIQRDQRRVGDLLSSSEQLFVGVRYGLAGILAQAWRRPDFVERTLPISETPAGWQYVPLHDFQTVARWAIDPDHATLEGMSWSGRPFFTAQLYLIARSAGDRIYIGMRGGAEALSRMSADELRQRRSWEISDRPRSSQWFTGTTFCALLEAKGVRFEQPETLADPE